VTNDIIMTKMVTLTIAHLLNDELKFYIFKISFIAYYYAWH